MARKNTKTIFVNDDEMRLISKYMHDKYPFIYRENTIYTACLVGMWKVRVREDCIEEVQSLLQPCEIHGFEL